VWLRADEERRVCEYAHKEMWPWARLPEAMVTSPSWIHVAPEPTVMPDLSAPVTEMWRVPLCTSVLPSLIEISVRPSIHA
jgi:hypothetical protein